jgi:TDG/mug DNA glycosylase family protein
MPARHRRADSTPSRFACAPETIGATKLQVLPNPSGLNANYQAAELAPLFLRLHQAEKERE